MNSALAVAVFQKVQTVAAGRPVSYPGVNFTPPDTGVWFSVSIFPQDVRNVATDNDAPSLHTGAVRVRVFNRPGGGILDLLAVANEVVAEFAKGSALGEAIVQEEGSVGAEIIDEDRQHVPVTIRYRGIF